MSNPSEDVIQSRLRSLPAVDQLLFDAPIHDLIIRYGRLATVDACRAVLDEYPVLCALDAKDYVELATRAINDGPFRESWREREARFYAEEIAGIARYSQRFFAAIDEVARRKAA